MATQHYVGRERRREREIVVLVGSDLTKWRFAQKTTTRGGIWDGGMDGWTEGHQSSPFQQQSRHAPPNPIEFGDTEARFFPQLKSFCHLDRIFSSLPHVCCKVKLNNYFSSSAACRAVPRKRTCIVKLKNFRCPELLSLNRR